MQPWQTLHIHLWMVALRQQIPLQAQHMDLTITTTTTIRILATIRERD